MVGEVAMRRGIPNGVWRRLGFVLLFTTVYNR
jgi:hypothetical protein